MPLYEYQCRECGVRSEVLQKMADPPLTTCTACGGPLKKLASSPSVQFKGSGWYVTDYARKGGGGKEAGGKEGGEKPAEAARGEGKAGEGKSGESKSGENKSGESKSAGDKASGGESKPAASATSSAGSGS